MSAGLRPYPAYKDSGEKWLGPIPEHWPMERAKWLFHKMDRPVRDHDEVVTCFRDGEVTLRKNRRVLGFTESLQEIGYQGVRRGDLVIHAMDAFAGAVGVSKSDGKSTPVYSVCEPVPRANAHYYTHLVREMARTQWILALAKGIRERSTDFRFEAFSSQRVPVPVTSEQAAIVRYLDYVDRRIRRYIRAKRKLMRLLAEQKQVVIHGVVSGRIDARTGKPYPAYKDSGTARLGDVPVSWDVTRLGRLIHLTTGFPFRSEGFTRSPDDIRLLRGINVAPGHVRWDDVVRWPQQDRSAFTQFEMKPGDIVLGMDRPIIRSGVRVAMLAESDVSSLLLQRVARIRAGSELLPGFALLLLRDKGFIDYLSPIFTGISVPHLSPEQIRSFEVALPPSREQAVIVARLAEVTGKMSSAAEHLHREIRLLREYSTRLIADVVTGKLDVREAAARLPDETEADVDVESALLEEEHADRGDGDPVAVGEGARA